MPSLLVTNDFPPKHGGIQSYLYELWRRLPPAETTVLTTPFAGAADWDAQQEFRIERVRQRVLLPSRSLKRRIDALAREVRADVIFLDPMLPLGLVGPHLTAAPYVIVAHGGEITGYARTVGSRGLARRVMRGAAAVAAAGTYPAAASEVAAGRSLAGIVIPPGVDHHRFRPLGADARAETRRRFGLDPERPLVLGVSRLVPRKGFDTVIDAVAGTALDGVQLAIAGAGRDRPRLERHAKGRVKFLGRVSDAELPALYACADVFAMCCRDRWGGREAEGFGIVFLEAAACGVPAVAGMSGGSHEAVADGETGFVVAPRDVGATRAAIARLVGDRELRDRMGEAARRRAVEAFDNDRLVADLIPVAQGDLSALGPLCR
ncbi:MAG: phosphatidyl-myo-inositol dimannoside synthase [Actinomycetota bacterium]|nr:phosphatidyl-myo-inositol dimannoside synthase [Actinomycetota bacterium]